MPKCPVCESELNDGYKFCKNCGTRINPEAASDGECPAASSDFRAEESTWVCRLCETVNTLDSCSVCGAARDSLEESEATVDTEGDSTYTPEPEPEFSVSEPTQVLSDEVPEWKCPVCESINNTEVCVVCQTTYDKAASIISEEERKERPIPKPIPVPIIPPAPPKVERAAPLKPPGSAITMKVFSIIFALANILLQIYLYVEVRERADAAPAFLVLSLIGLSFVCLSVKYDKPLIMAFIGIAVGVSPFYYSSLSVSFSFLTEDYITMALGGLTAIFLLSYYACVQSFRHKLKIRAAEEEAAKEIETAFRKYSLCPFCGKSIETDSRFCFFCGKDLSTYTGRDDFSYTHSSSSITDKSKKEIDKGFSVSSGFDK